MRSGDADDVSIAADRRDVGPANVERVGVGRHRRRHVIKPAPDRLAIITKGTPAQKEREQLARATEAIVAASIDLQAQVKKLEAIEARLERMSAVAEMGQAPASVAQLAGQQLRAIETGSRLGVLVGMRNSGRPTKRAQAPRSRCRSCSLAPATPTSARPVSLGCVAAQRERNKRANKSRHRVPKMQC